MAVSDIQKNTVIRELLESIQYMNEIMNRQEPVLISLSKNVEETLHERTSIKLTLSEIIWLNEAIRSKSLETVHASNEGEDVNEHHFYGELMLISSIYRELARAFLEFSIELYDRYGEKNEI